MKKIIFSFVLAFSFTSAFAQYLLPSGQNWGNHTNSCGEVYIGTTGPIAPCTTGSEVRRMMVDAGVINYSAGIAINARAETNGTTGQTQGVATASMATATDYFAQGVVVGQTGSASNVSLLNVTVPDRTTAALGGAFTADISDPIASPTVGRYEIAGVRGRLDGTISTYPVNGVVSAGYFADNIQGSGTWAGYFEGRGYFEDNVGIGNGTPSSMLSVNTAGDNRHVVSAYSASASSGATAVYAEAAAGAGADHVAAIQGVIEAGSGYTYGVRGNATTTSPSNAGRAYGVWGRAGNATTATNFGVYGELTGSNGGTAILGYDRIKDGGAWGGILPTTDTYAGFFYGDAHVTDRMGIGSGALCLNTLAAAAPTTSNYRLFVDGGIAAKEIFVSSGLPWCDYVFEKDYELTSLEDVEKHIEEKGHLHKIASAKEIDEQGGFEVAKITVNQQEKIEEIFLHLIEMNKKIEILETENQALKSQIAAQK